jgi:hypothetical protein
VGKVLPARVLEQNKLAGGKWSERRDSNPSGTTGQFPLKLAYFRMNQWVTYDSHFDQHEAKPRFCEEVLSYRVMQMLKRITGLRNKMFSKNSFIWNSRFPSI